MVNPEGKKNQRHRSIRIVGGGGGDIGAVIAWGGAMAIAGLVAFAIKTRFGRRKAKEPGKEEQVKKTENVEEQNNGGGRGEEDKPRLNDANMNLMQTQIKGQIDSVDLVSALLGEKPKDKDEGAAHHHHLHHNHHQDIGPLINYAIPAHTEIVDPFSTMNPEVQEIIPFTKLKPEVLAGIVEECKSLVDGPVPLKEVQGPVERLILKPVMNQVEAEALLSPITEVEEHDDDYGRGEGEEHADADEEEGDGESVLDKIGEKSSAIWPAEMIDELSRELKGMKIELERPREEDKLKQILGKDGIDSIKVMNTEFRILRQKEKVVVPVTRTVELSRSRTLMRLSMFGVFLLLLLLIRFDAMSSVLRET